MREIEIAEHEVRLQFRCDQLSRRLVFADESLQAFLVVMNLNNPDASILGDVPVPVELEN
jgi:hypothetical protein